MKPNRVRCCLILKTMSFAVVCTLAGCQVDGGARAGENRSDYRVLPTPDTARGMPLNEALFARRSVRRFTPRALTENELGQLLWAGQGVTSPHGFRTAPSAGALYPLEIHVVTEGGVFRYNPQKHRTERLVTGDRRSALAQAFHGQDWVVDGSAVFVVAGVVSRTRSKYGTRAERYVVFEAGAAVQNMLLQAVNLGLGAVVVGAYHDEQVGRIAALPRGSTPLAVVPVGEPTF